MDDSEIDRLWDDLEFRKALHELEKASEKAPVISFGEEVIAGFLLELQKRISSRTLSSDLGKKFDAKLARNIRYRYSKFPLSTEGNIYSNGRFHRKGIDNPTFYLAENEIIAHAERRVSGLKAVSPHLCFWVKSNLQNILDLTQNDNDFFLDDSEKNVVLRLPYQFFNDVLEIDSPTQIIAKKAKQEGYEGILYSSIREEGICLAVFCDKLLIGSTIEIIGKDDFQDTQPDDLLVKGEL